MAWVSAHEGVRDHPKTRALARKLQCSRHEAIGILVTLWLWGLNNADRDGNILSATADDIADGIMYRGQSAGQSAHEAAEHLLESLISTGWIDVADDGHFILHDWDVWQDQWYKALDKRAKEAERKRKQRQCDNDSEMSAGQDYGQSTGQDNGTSDPNRNRNRDRNHNRNLNINRDPKEESDVADPSLQEKRFNEFWTAYPKKVGKKAAWAAWKKVKPDAELFDKIMTSISKAKATEQWQRENGRFIPNPTTWLNQGRWDDEYEEGPTNGINSKHFNEHNQQSAANTLGTEGKRDALAGFKRVEDYDFYLRPVDKGK